MLDLIGNIESILTSFGYLALFAIVFAESGLFFGFFLPGDSLLFTAGLLASKGLFDLQIVLIGVAVSAIVGDQVGYWMGSRYGRGFFSREGSILRNPSHIREAEEFYQKHGRKMIVIARFVPVVRTFAPIVAGIGKMDYRTFLTFNILGGILWTVVFILAGFLLGQVLPNANEVITLIVFAIIVVSLIPVGLEVWKGLNK